MSLGNTQTYSYWTFGNKVGGRDMTAEGLRGTITSFFHFHKKCLSLNKKNSNWKTQNLIWCHVCITPSFYVYIYMFIYIYMLQVRQCCFIYSSTIGVFQKEEKRNSSLYYEISQNVLCLKMIKNSNSDVLWNFCKYQ